MSLQFNEYYHSRTGLTVDVKRQLFSRQTDFQLVEVYETASWGNLMTIDGLVMLSERDEFVYHEMLTHVAMFTHPSPENVLIIGGGDGGTAREVMKHSSVKKVDLVEIDEAVIEASKRFLPDVGDFRNPKLSVVIQDGIQFVESCTDKYDVVIVDGSDPVGPAEGLFNEDFCRNCHQVLNEQGIMVTQTESPWVTSYHPGIRKIHRILSTLFQNTQMYLCYIPLYPAGMWSMMLASKDLHPLDETVIKRTEEGLKGLKEMKYYNKEIHQSAFALPGFVRNIL